MFLHLHRGMEPTRNDKLQGKRSQGGTEMDQTFCFIGDPGPRRIERLEILRAAGLKPVRINPCQRELEGLESDLPCALVVGAEVVNRADLIAEIRQRASLDGLPLIARVREPNLFSFSPSVTTADPRRLAYAVIFHSAVLVYYL